MRRQPAGTGSAAPNRRTICGSNALADARANTVARESPFEGTYALTIEIGSGCTAVPETERTRMQFALANNNDEAHGGHIVEQTASGTWLEIIGEVVGSRNVVSMEAAGRGSVWRCPESRGYPYPCSSFVFCDSTELRLRLTRR